MKELQDGRLETMGGSKAGWRVQKRGQRASNSKRWQWVREAAVPQTTPGTATREGCTGRLGSTAVPTPLRSGSGSVGVGVGQRWIRVPAGCRRVSTPLPLLSLTYRGRQIGAVLVHQRQQEASSGKQGCNQHNLSKPPQLGCHAPPSPPVKGRGRETTSE